MGKKDSRFHFELLSGWMDQTVYVFQGPNMEGIDHSIMLTIDRNLQHDDIENMAYEKTAPIEESLDGIEVLKNEEITIEDGNPAWDFVYRWIPADNMKFFCKYVFVMKDGMGFTFFGKFTKQTLKTLGAQMKQIIESLLPGTYQPPEED
jgi:hypothetical protein